MQEALKLALERNLAAEFERVLALAKTAYHWLHSLRHANGALVVEFHCAQCPPTFGTVCARLQRFLVGPSA